MTKWSKTCNSFKKVREIVLEDIETVRHCMRIMVELECCCDELTPNESENWEFYDDFRDMKSEIHEEIEFMDENDYDSCADVVNSYLAEFYDLCDCARVWLPV